MTYALFPISDVTVNKLIDRILSLESVEDVVADLIISLVPGKSRLIRA